MQEMKDPAFKLFGKTIPLLIADENEKQKSSTADEKAEKDHLEGKSSMIKRQDDAPQPNKSNLTIEETFADTNENPRTPSIDEEAAIIITSKAEKDQNDTVDSQEKPLTKPDKLIPCPRCNSMDTKFCYYNNYNLHQPRHFCKSCQRYWTAGGNMRNVPVGAGRRKNKNAAASHYRHITVSEALQAARIDAPNGVVDHLAVKCNETVLNFGSDASLSQSVASGINVTEKTLWNGTNDWFRKMEERRIHIPSSVGENGNNQSSGSSVMATNSTEEEGRNCTHESFMPNFGFTPQIQCLPGVPWPYQWNSAVHPPAFCHPGLPISFYPATYWNRTIPCTWNVPWTSPPIQKAQNPCPNSPTLGKHSRDADMLQTEKEGPQRPKNSERGIWVQKKLRIDDPDEAAKSSIWTTLGIKNESINKGGIFKAFQPKNIEKNHVAETSPVLRANPSALSRSINFHESS